MNIGQSESESPVDKKRLLYIDSYLAVFNKACGDICEQPSLPFIFARCFKDLYGDSKPLPSFIHCFNRLDRPVSGAVLLVFDKALLPRLQNQFTEHQKKALAVKKVYTAVLEGSLPISGDFALLEHYLRFDARRQKAFVCEKDARNIEAILNAHFRSWHLRAIINTHSHADHTDRASRHWRMRDQPVRHIPQAGELQQ